MPTLLRRLSIPFVLVCLGAPSAPEPRPVGAAGRAIEAAPAAATDARAEALERVRREQALIRAERSVALLGEWIEARRTWPRLQP